MGIPNDSYVLVTDIGMGSNGLHCGRCCRVRAHPNGVAQGHWYHPDGREVRSFTGEDTGSPRNFFSRDRIHGIVCLNRIGNPPDGGCYRCEIPDAYGDTETLYVSIGKNVFCSIRTCA